jgi:hypothetical protein
MAIAVEITQSSDTLERMWSWRMETEKFVNGPFPSADKAKAAALRHYKGATIQCTTIPARSIQ